MRDLFADKTDKFMRDNVNEIRKCYGLGYDFVVLLDRLLELNGNEIPPSQVPYLINKVKCVRAELEAFKKGRTSTGDVRFTYSTRELRPCITTDDWIDFWTNPIAPNLRVGQAFLQRFPKIQMMLDADVAFAMHNERDSAQVKVLICRAVHLLTEDEFDVIT